VKRRSRGLEELYADDPARADAILGLDLKGGDRRRVLRVIGSASAALFLSEALPFARLRPPGLIPAALAQTEKPFAIEGKEGLIVLTERPINAETPIRLLDDEVTPNDRHYVRNNGGVPERAGTRDLTGWSLTIDGEVGTPLSLDLADLKSRYPNRTLQLQLECAGNGRAGFRPPTSGLQWRMGGIGCAAYTGVRLKDVLESAGLTSAAVYVAYYAEDPHLSGNPNAVPISRGLPLEKAMEDFTLLAWEMNGEALPAQHGFPLRLVAPGWPASASGKWLKRLWVRDRVHDGEKMGGHSYRVPRHPVEPGTDVPDGDMEIIGAMPVKSVITRPTTGIEQRSSDSLSIRGHAWCGDGSVRSMHVSIDFGARWMEADLQPPRNPFAWQRWSAEIRFPTTGHYEVWARATDQAGRQQPMVVPGWNPGGYLNNAMHRIAVRVV
jgi:DMSO/TMAO reductase YedYZ molybdopterin-dependent catalytic subunit